MGFHLLLSFILSSLLVSFAFAENRRIVHQGRVLRPDGSGLNGSFQMEARIYSPSPSSCLLWGESKSVNFTRGVFTIDIGENIFRMTGASGGRSINFQAVFVNNSAYNLTGASCETGSTYNPASSDGRKLVVTLYDGPQIIKVYEGNIRSVPYAIESANAGMVGGYDAAHIFKFNEMGAHKPSLTFSTLGASFLWDLAESSSVSNRRLTNLADPVDPTDAVNLQSMNAAITAAVTGGTIPTVTHVDAEAGANASTVLDISGGPVTTHGTFSFSFLNQGAGLVFAAPTGAAGAPTFRSLDLTDIPALNAAKITSGTLPVSRGGTGLGSFTPYALLASNMTGDALVQWTCADGEILVWRAATGWACEAKGASGGGTVTEVTAGTGLLGGSITSAGTLSVDVGLTDGKIVQVGAGDKIPAALIPNLDMSSIASGTLGTARGGTGLDTSTAANGQLLIGNGSGFSLNTLTAGTGISITNAAGSISISSSLGGGTVTNVGLTAPTSVFTVTNSPVTGAGTMDISLNSQAAASVFAAPTGATGAPTFRSLASTDIPGLDAAKITSGTLGVDRGGTGLVPAVGDANQLYGVNNSGTAAEFKTLAAGTGLSITHSAGTISFSVGSLGVSPTFPLFGPMGTANDPTYSFAGDSNTGIFSPLADNFSIATGGVERLRVSNMGNVGIGVAGAGASSPLEVRTSSTSAPLMLSRSNNSTTPANIAFVPAGVESASSVRWNLGMPLGDAAFELSSYDGSALSSRLYVNAAGNVGIGVTAPTSKLHIGVDGNKYTFKMDGSTTADRGLYLGASYDSAVIANAIYWNGTQYIATHVRASLIHQSNGDINFLTSTGAVGAQSPTSKMYIKNDGRIGVATNTPTAAFDVATTGTLASAIRIPRDSTANRPVGSTPADLQGMMRYNTTDNKYEVYEGSNWASLSTGSAGATQWTDHARGILYSSGSVGIGIAPASKLDIVDTDYWARNSTIGNFTLGTNAPMAADRGAMIALGGLTDGSADTKTFATLSGRKENGTSGNVAGYFSVHVRHPSAGMVETIYANSNNMVGLGTASPTAALDIASNGTFGSAIRIPRDTTANRPAAPGVGMIRYNTTDNKYEVYESSGWASLATGSGTAAASQWSDVAAGINYAGGSVGIGTSTPLGNLQVRGAGSMQMTLGPSTDANANATLSLQAKSGGAVNEAIISANWAGELQLRPSTGQDTVLYSGSSPIVTARSNGFVGIGTTTPFTMLHIDGGRITAEMAGASGVYAPTGNGSGPANGLNLLNLKNTNPSDASLNFIGMETTNAASATQNFVMGLVPNPSGYSPNFVFTQQTSSNTWAERMRLDSAGRFGIGTTTPGSALDVNGAFTVRGIASPAVSPTGQGVIYFDSTTNKFKVSQNGDAYTDLVASGAGDFKADGSVAMTGQFRAIDGTAAAPSVSFANDTTSGMYSSGTNSIGFSTAGTERLRIDPTGNIGIGTTTPGTALHVYATSARAKLESTGGVAVFTLSKIAGASANIDFSTGTTRRWAASVTGAESGSDAGGDMYFTRYNDAGSSLGTPLFLSRSSGNVGIGTTSPQGPLDVQGGSSTTGSGANINIVGQNALSGATAYIGGSINLTAGNGNAGTTHSGRGGEVALSGGTGGTSSRGGIVRLTGGASGPSFTGAAGSVLITGGASTVGSGGVVSLNGGSSSSGNGGPVNIFGGNATGATKLGGELYFISGRNADGTYAPTKINAFGGAVGIGTPTPMSPLHVGGAAGTTEGLARFTTSDYSDGFSGSGLFVKTGANTGDTFTSLSALSRGFTLTNDLILNPDGGRVGIGTTLPGSALDVNGAVTVRGIASPPASTAGQGVIYFDSTENKFKVSQNNDPYTDLVASGSGDFKADGSVAMTGAFKATDGTASTPGMAFASDLNTGIFRPSADRISLTAGGTSRMTATADKGVYVGTEPTYYAAFAVTGNGPSQSFQDTSNAGVAATNSISFRDSSGTEYIVIGDRSNTLNNLKLWATSGEVNLSSGLSKAITFDQNGTEAMRVDTTGNVGIGTTSPTTKLEVAGTVKATAFQGDGSGLTGVSAAATPAGANTEIQFNDSGVVGATADLTFNKATKTLRAGRIGINGTATAQIETNANLAGTYVSADNWTAPAVASGFRTSNTATGDGYFSMYNLSVNNALTNEQNAYFGAVSNAGAGTYTPTLVWGQQTGATAYTERMRIDSSGRVGIGTTSPSVSLDVAGQINSTVTSPTAYLASSAALARPAVIGAGATLGLKNLSNATLASTMLSFETRNSNSLTQNAYIGSLSEAGAANYTPSIVFGQQTGATAYQERMRINSSGNVGIGTTTPGGARLAVQDHLTGGYAIMTVTNTSTSAYSGAGVRILSGTSGSMAGLNVMENGSGGGQFSISTSDFFTDGIQIASGMSISNAPIWFKQGSFERMRIADNGFVGINNNSPTYTLDVTGSINATGCVRAGGTTLGGTCPSDERLKADIQAFDLGLDALLGITPHLFKYNGLGGHPASEKPELGVIAQEVEATAPQLIVTKELKLKPNDTETTEIKQVNYTAFTYVLINAVKELYGRWFADSQTLHRELASLKANDQAKDQKIQKLEQDNAAKTKELEEIKVRLDKIEKMLNSK